MYSTRLASMNALERPRSEVLLTVNFVLPHKFQPFTASRFPSHLGATHPTCTLITMVSRLTTTRSLDSISLNYEGTLDYYHNVTGHDEDLLNESEDTAVVLVLAILVFLLVSMAIFCINLDKARRRSQGNFASDGRTVTSKDEVDDLEEGQTTAPNSDNGKNEEVPAVVAVVEETETVI